MFSSCSRLPKYVSGVFLYLFLIKVDYEMFYFFFSSLGWIRSWRPGGVTEIVEYKTDKIRYFHEFLVTWQGLHLKRAFRVSINQNSTTMFAELMILCHQTFYVCEIIKMIPGKDDTPVV